MRRENLYQKTKTKDKQTKKHKYLHVSYCHINNSKKQTLNFKLILIGTYVPRMTNIGLQTIWDFAQLKSNLS